MPEETVTKIRLSGNALDGNLIKNKGSLPDTLSFDHGDGAVIYTKSAQTDLEGNPLYLFSRTVEGEDVE